MQWQEDAQQMAVIVSFTQGRLLGEPDEVIRWCNDQDKYEGWDAVEAKILDFTPETYVMSLDDSPVKWVVQSKRVKMEPTNTLHLKKVILWDNESQELDSYGDAVQWAREFPGIGDDVRIISVPKIAKYELDKPAYIRAHVVFNLEK